jgi:hypothetical protein
VFQTVSLLRESRCKTCRYGTNLNLNFWQRTHLIHSIGPKAHVSARFEPFCYYMKVDAKPAELAPLTHKFAKQTCVEIFRNERT